MSVLIAPSILSADFAALGGAVAAIERGGAGLIHVDVMDGHFVPNITIGPPVVAALRRVTTLPLDVHLMIERPEHYVAAFADAGASCITVHQEASVHLHRTIQQIHQMKRRAGVAINPATPVSVLDEILPFLIMSVNPGFGGQKFIETSPAKIRSLKETLHARGLSSVDIEVDGGVAPDTALQVVSAGATVLVAGAAVFNDDATVAENIVRLRRAVSSAQSRSIMV
jgi:ribulose-phosphate 3-epimerase